MGFGAARVAGIIGCAGLLAWGVQPFDAGEASSAEARGLTATLRNVRGRTVGTVRFVPRRDGKIRITARIVNLPDAGRFHALHIHSSGTCDPDARGGPFTSAGPHFNPKGRRHGLHAGDLPPLLVAADRSAVLRIVTDRFRNVQLRRNDGTSVVVHAAPDNLAQIPPTTTSGGTRYHSHLHDSKGPDTLTRKSGDAGPRIACGVIEKRG